MLSRRAMREQAFMLMFEQSFSNYELDQVIKLATEARDIPEDASARELAAGAIAHTPDIDPIIEKHSVDRKFSRLSRVVVTVLRLALYEIIYVDSMGTAISINEAVEITKRFATDEEAGFVNGVLGAYVRSQEQ